MALIGQILADTDGWGHMTGWGWSWMALGWVFWLSVIVLVVWVVSRRTGEPPKTTLGPEEILAERFARGELSIEEFEERLAALRG